MRRLSKEQIKNARKNGWEKEAIAWAAGQDIEYSPTFSKYWTYTPKPGFYHTYLYRIVKPKPVMVKVDRDNLLAHLANYIDSRGFIDLEHVKTMLKEAEVVE